MTITGAFQPGTVAINASAAAVTLASSHADEVLCLIVEWDAWTVWQCLQTVPRVLQPAADHNSEQSFALGQSLMLTDLH